MVLGHFATLMPVGKSEGCVRAPNPGKIKQTKTRVRICGQPCVRFAYGRCRGGSCQFCHLEHETKIKLDAGHRFCYLGRPARCPFSPPFLGGGFNPTRIDYRKNFGYQLILSSLLEDLAMDQYQYWGFIYFWCRSLLTVCLCRIFGQQLRANLS